eukprot:10479297-Prorocentrum_lima.AAC.1
MSPSPAPLLALKQRSRRNASQPLRARLLRVAMPRSLLALFPFCTPLGRSGSGKRSGLVPLHLKFPLWLSLIHISEPTRLDVI